MLRVLLGALLVWGMLLPVEAQQVVQGVGVILQQNQAAARFRALQDALRKALEQAVAEVLGPAVLVEQLQAFGGSLHTWPPRYIRSYRVLWEYPDVTQKVYRLGLDVEVDNAEIAQALQALGIVPRGRETGQILVRIVEHQLAQTAPGLTGSDGGVVADGLRTHLYTEGFRVVRPETDAAWDEPERSALAAGKEAGAEVVLIGRAEVQKLRSEVAGTALQAMQATAQVQALVTATGERLALERVQTTALHADARLGARQALEKAAAALATRLVPSLRAYQQRQQGQASTARDGR
jgi:hypothetical protein